MAAYPENQLKFQIGQKINLVLVGMQNLSKIYGSMLEIYVVKNLIFNKNKMAAITVLPFIRLIVLL